MRGLLNILALGFAGLVRRPPGPPLLTQSGVPLLTQAGQPILLET